MIQENWELIFVGKQKYGKVVLLYSVDFVGRRAYYQNFLSCCAALSYRILATLLDE